jgi:hypothetical protein
MAKHQQALYYAEHLRLTRDADSVAQFIEWWHYRSDITDHPDFEMFCRNKPDPGLPMLLWCPSCNTRHIDTREFSTKPHHTHACQSCGMTWRPAVVPTVGVQFLPGFKNE